MSFARRLKPNHLQLLVRIGETGQLQIAAEMSAMSQPAASRILADIEVQAGSPLFERHAKGMVPTKLGEVCLQHATVILEEFDAIDAQAGRLAAGETGHVRVGAVTGPAVGLLMPAIRQVKESAPGIEVTIEVGPSTELVRGLFEGRFDFVVSRLPPEYDSRDFRMHPARSEIVSLLVRPGHPLAGQEKLPLSALLDFEWVAQEIGSPIRQAVEQAFLGSGLTTPPNVTNSSSLLVVLAMLEQTDAIAPLASEVGNLLADGPIGANLLALDLEAPITVSPCFVIQQRHRKLLVAAERVHQAVLRNL